MEPIFFYILFIGGIAFVILLATLFYIIKNQETMASEIQELIEKVKAQGTSLDNIATSVGGVKKDVAFLKKKITELEGGATAEQIAELKSVILGADEKINNIASEAGALDAETDSEETVPDTGEGTPPTETNEQPQNN